MVHIFPRAQKSVPKMIYPPSRLLKTEKDGDFWTSADEAILVAGLLQVEMSQTIKNDPCVKEKLWLKV